MKRGDEEGNDLHESRRYDMSFRGTSGDLASVKVYTNKNSFQIDKQISFDTEDMPISSVDYFAGSVLSSIMLAVLEQSKREGAIVEEIEGVLRLTLANPLTLLGVRGYDEEPSISRMTVTVFLNADLGEEAFEAFCARALARSPIYHTLKRSMALEVHFKQLL